MGYKSELRWPPPWVHVIFLEQLTGLRKAVDSLDSQFIKRILKDLNQHPNERIHRGNCQAKELCPCGVWGLAGWPVAVFVFPTRPGSSPNPVPLGSEESIGHWRLRRPLAPRPSPEVGGGGGAVTVPTL